MNTELVFEIIFDNELYFKDLEVEKAKLLVCTYKSASEKSHITTPIEIDKGKELCNKLYNTIRDMIINIKYIAFKNNIYDDVLKHIKTGTDFGEIVEEYYKLTVIAKEEFNQLVVSDYLEFLKPCVMYMCEKEDLLIAENYKKLLDIIGIHINQWHIQDNEFVFEENKHYYTDAESNGPS